MADQVILRTAAKVLMPFITLFGFYVIVHGEGGPGGGFQGGVILAASFILYVLVYGVKRSEQIFRRAVTDIAAALGVSLYAGVGVVAVLRGGNFLDYNALAPHDPGHAQGLGMSLVEYGVGLTVAAVMITLFREFVEGEEG